MTKVFGFGLTLFVLTLTNPTASSQTSGGPETVVVHSESATLHAMLWRPQGGGPFPAILLNHGSGRTREDLERLGPYELMPRNSDRFSLATAMYFCTCLGAVCGFQQTRAPTPLT